MNINKFTQKSIQAVQQCERIAMDYGNQEIEQEHLLYALLTQDDSLILKLMQKMGLDGNAVINRVEEALRKLVKVQGGQQHHTGQSHDPPGSDFFSAFLRIFLAHFKTSFPYNI